MLLWRLNNIIYLKSLEKCPAHWKCFQKSILIPKILSYSKYPFKSVTWSKWGPLDVFFASLIWGYSSHVPEKCRWLFSCYNLWKQAVLSGERNLRECRSVSFLPSYLLINSVCYCDFCLHDSLKLSLAHVAFNGFLLLNLVDTFRASLTYTFETFDFSYFLDTFCSFGFHDNSYFCFTSCLLVTRF